MYQDLWTKKSVPECFSVAVDRDAGGKILRREEHWPEGVRCFRYAYDASGHLLRVQCDGREQEAYAYNGAGQRVEDVARGIRYTYDADGRLTHAGALRMAYDKGGRLVSRARQGAAAARASVPPLLREARSGRREERSGESGAMEFRYDGNRLAEVRLPDGALRSYHYEGNARMPSRVLDDGELCLAWEWKGRQTPVRCVDARSGLGYDWGYEGGGEPLPTHVGIQGEAVRRLGIAGGSWGTDKDYFLLGLDQVGSFRALINGAGSIVKRVDYDSFGNVLFDSLPELYIPLGFGGGIVDRATGLVQFGCRHYDPEVGRFISPDPAKDRRGDGDLYDYCVDDPVGRVDRDGRFFFLPLLAGIGGGAVMGLLGSWFAARSADNMKEERTGKASTAARDGVVKVAPLVGMTAATGLAAGNLAASAPEAALSAWLRPGLGMAALDTGLAFYEPKLPPPSMLPGQMTYLLNNAGEVRENAAVFSRDVLRRPAPKNENCGLDGGKCTPETQPPDSRGRFAHCSHSK